MPELHSETIAAPTHAASENAARESDFQLADSATETLIQNSRDGIIGFDLECRYTIWNPAMERLSGMSAEAVLGRCAFDVFPFLKEIGQDKYFFAALQGKTVACNERSYSIPETGRTGTFEGTYSPLRGADGQIIGGLGIIRDTTERREREEAERRLEAEHKVAQILAEVLTLEEGAPEILRALCESIDGQIGEIWTIEGATHLKCSAIWTDAESHEFKDFIDASRCARMPKGIGLPGRVWDSGQAVCIRDLSTDKNFPRSQWAAKCELKSGLAFPIATGAEFFGTIEFFTKRVLDPDEKLLRMMSAIGRDIAQFIRRRRAEAEVKRLNRSLEHRVAELEALLEVLPVGIAIAHDPQCREITANAAFTELLGLGQGENISKSGPQADKLPYQILRNGEPCPADELPMQAAATKGIKPPPTECEVVLSDKRRVHLLISAAPLFDERNQIRGAIAAHVDITEQKQAENYKNALSDLGRKLNAARTAKEAARIVLETADNLFGWDACSFDLYSPEENRIEPLLNIDVLDGERSDAPAAYSGKPPSPQIRKVIEDGPLLILREENPGFHPELIPFGNVSRPSASLMFVPIRNADKVIGLLSIQSYTRNAYDNGKLQMLQTLANHCGVALERIHAEEKLRFRENQLRLITDALPVVVGYVDSSQRYRFNNKQYEAWFGCSCAELYGKTMKEVLGEKRYELNRPQIEAALSGKEVTFESWAPHKILGNRYVHTTCIPDISSKGEVRGFILLSADITEHKQAEDRLRFLVDASVLLSSSLEYEVTLQNVAKLAVPTIADWCIVDVLKTDGALHRLVVAHTDPSKVEVGRELQLHSPPSESGSLWAVVRSGKPEICEDLSDAVLRETAGDEKQFQTLRGLGWKSRLIVPLVARSKVFGAITLISAESSHRFTEADLSFAELLGQRAAIAIDNARLYRQVAEEHTKAQSNEAYFRNLAEVIPHMVWTSDTNGHFEYCNHRWCEYTGQTFEESQGMGWIDAVHPEHVERVRLAWQRSLQSREIYEIEYPLRGRDGGYRWHLDRALPLKDATGKITKWFGTCTDIHEKKLTTEIFRQMNQVLEQRVDERTKALREVNEQMESFCYTVSHDLRAPLRAMRAFTQVLLEDYLPKLDPAGQDFLHRVSNAAERMDSLIQDLLQYSRLGRMELNFASVDLEKIIESVVLDLRLEIRARGAVVNVSKPMPKVVAHETVLQQVLFNLISNALKFVRAEVTPEINIWAEFSGDKVRISVRDNGIGIPTEYHDRIFRVFERLHGVESYPGTGIGLAIVQKGIDRMKGKVGLESKPGEGSCFWVELPGA